MVSVVILILAQAGKLWNACQEITKIDGVSKADVVTGPYDIIVYAELPSNQDLRLLMKSIHEIEGITRTETCVAI